MCKQKASRALSIADVGRDLLICPMIGRVLVLGEQGCGLCWDGVKAGSGQGVSEATVNAG